MIYQKYVGPASEMVRFCEENIQPGYANRWVFQGENEHLTCIKSYIGIKWYNGNGVETEKTYKFQLDDFFAAHTLNDLFKDGYYTVDGRIFTPPNIKEPGHRDCEGCKFANWLGETYWPNGHIRWCKHCFDRESAFRQYWTSKEEENE